MNNSIFPFRIDVGYLTSVVLNAIDINYINAKQLVYAKVYDCINQTNWSVETNEVGKWLFNNGIDEFKDGIPDYIDDLFINLSEFLSPITMYLKDNPWSVLSARYTPDSIIIEYVNDYRIMEWEQGRGRKK